MNGIDRLFKDLEYLNTINIQYWKLLSNITKRGEWKLYPVLLTMDIRFGRSMHHSNIQYHIISYLESQMNYNRNCLNNFQLSQFEWIVIVVDSSIQSRQQNHWNYIDQFESIPMIHNSICGMISIYYSHNNSFCE